MIGASAGGVETLTKLVAGLPADLPAAIFVVLHISPDGTSVLPKILNRAGPLEAIHPKHGQAIKPGRIYVAPPDLHLLVKPGYIHLARGPHENRHRPALWSALRALEESGALAHRMARRARENNQNLVANRYEQRAQSIQQQAEIIRQVLLKGVSNIPDKSPSQEI